MRGIVQSLFDERSQLSGSGQFVPVSKDRIKPGRHFSEISIRSNQVLGDAKRLKFLPEPPRPFFVLVGVSYECSVLVRSLAQFRCMIYRIEGTGKDSRLLFVSGFMSGNP